MWCVPKFSILHDINMLLYYSNLSSFIKLVVFLHLSIRAANCWNLPHPLSNSQMHTWIVSQIVPQGYKYVFFALFFYYFLLYPVFILSGQMLINWHLHPSTVNASRKKWKEVEHLYLFEQNGKMLYIYWLVKFFLLYELLFSL